MVVVVKRSNTSDCDSDIRRFESDWPPYDYADVVELADTLDLGSSVARRESSTLSARICASAQQDPTGSFPRARPLYKGLRDHRYDNCRTA